MTPLESEWIALASYPTAPGGAVRGVDIRIAREPRGSLTLQYVLRADMLHLRVPPTARPARADGLWMHTCFEAFIASAAASTAYYELNFSPSLQWAIYSFEAYRQGMSPTAVTVPPKLTVRAFDDRLELDAAIELHDLQALGATHTLKLAVTAVIEDDSGTLSYWALKHAPGKPDFHHPDGFALELQGKPMSNQSK
ncbi:MAG TPA: DOMON-like domain-containing protein [Steroidobacteraceae bacterium]